MPTQKKADHETHIEGGIHAGRDYVAGDQNNVTIGSVTGSTLAVGTGGQVNSRAPGGASLADLVILVAEMRRLLPETPLDKDTQEVVDGSFKVVADQLKKPEPKKALVLPSLKTVAETLTLTATAGAAVTKLAPLVQQAIAWAQQLLK